MEKDERQTLNELLKITSVRRRYGAHGRVISYDEAVEQLERELLKVLRGTGVSKIGWKFNPTEPIFLMGSATADRRRR